MEGAEAMAGQIEITQADVDNLATKLDSLSESLSDGERRLLSRMLQLAGHAIEQATQRTRVASDKPDVDAPFVERRLADRFRESFARGEGTMFIIIATEDANGNQVENRAV
jgi:hypothetical protein